MRRGTFCRACGSSQHLELDHIKPRSQGGQSDVENGLPLCGAWGSCGAHARKTAGSLRIQKSWLDPDQIAYLDQIGWVRWDPETGEVSGNGWRHFEPEQPPTQEMSPHMSMTDENEEVVHYGNPEDDLPLEDDLAAAADAAMSYEPEPSQDHLPGTNYAKTKFVGMSHESAERPGLKEEVEYRVRGICMGHAEEVMADGDIREVAKVKVTSMERIIP